MRYLAILIAVLGLLGVPATVHAQSGKSFTSQGRVGAAVVDPTRIEHREDLRFGAFFAPTTYGEIEVEVDGTIIDRGGVAGNVSAIQPPDGRGPGHFRIYGTPRRVLIAFLPLTLQLTNAAGDTMTLDNLQTTLDSIRVARFNTDGEFDLYVGGTLQVQANQPTGAYRGEFEVTVFYP